MRRACCWRPTSRDATSCCRQRHERARGWSCAPCRGGGARSTRLNGGACTANERVVRLVGGRGETQNGGDPWRDDGSRVGEESAHPLRSTRGVSGDSSIDVVACKSVTLWPRSCGREQRTGSGVRTGQNIAFDLQGPCAEPPFLLFFSWAGVHDARILEGVAPHARLVEN